MAVCSTITQFHIVMEYFHSHSLFDIIFNTKIGTRYFMNLDNKNNISYKLCCALAYLHLQPVPLIHRDIKPANVLVNDKFETKLCDLGLCKCDELEVSLQLIVKGHMCGTFMFMAPEIILDREEATVNSDIWYFACTLIELFSETDVWKLKHSFNGFHSFISYLENKQTPNTDEVPKHLKHNIEQCFNHNPILRPKIMTLLFEAQKK